MCATHRYHAQYEQGHIDHHHPKHCRHQVVQQFHGLAWVGGNQVEKHVDGDYTPPEEVEQHHLESSEEYQDKSPPHHLAHLGRKGHQSHVHTHGQEYIGKARHKRHTLGEAQGHIGQR